MTPPCEDRQQLEKQLLVAAHQHMLLAEATKAAMPSELTEARQQEERARAAWELAASALKEHRSRHGC